MSLKSRITHHASRITFHVSRFTFHVSRITLHYKGKMSNNLPKQNILIVDDVPANIKMLQVTLMADYEISVSTNGPEAISIANSISPDLILLDIMMPGMDGYEVCRRLKADSLTRNIPIIFITAISEEEEETKGFDVGAVDYITKPFSPAIVRARVSTQLDLKRHRDHLEKLNVLLKEEIAERRRSEEALKHLLKKQEVNIDLAKKLLSLVNEIPSRYTDLSDGLVLFADAISVPCYAEGGDHYFVRTLVSDQGKKTVISVKDQSGHEVSCVLRSSITDLMHNAVLNHNGSEGLEAVISRLNDEICYSEIFNKDDFFTSLNAEIDHETLVIRYASAGHPPFIFIRGDDIRLVPEYGEPGANIPIAIEGGMLFSAGEIRLQEGDKLVFYTDGLTEMPLKNLKKMIRSDELKSLLGNIISQSPCPRTKNGVPVSDIMDEILKRVSEMSSEEVSPPSTNTSSDDITLLCLEIENRKHDHETVLKPGNSDDIAKSIIALCKRIEYNLTQYRYSDRIPFRTVLEEAVLNAWIHGNNRDPEKSVTVRWRFGNDFHIEVTDQGKGFDYASLPDPTMKENITKPSGKGLFIIRHFSDYIRWEKGGRRLTMSFKKHHMPAEDPPIMHTRKLMNLWSVVNCN
ncbi:response regulator [Desulfococcaceae bacterium HSG8]|nr:response regulator [Desulfococcaceae bacterium HSG8]